MSVLQHNKGALAPFSARLIDVNETTVFTAVKGGTIIDELHITNTGSSGSAYVLVDDGSTTLFYIKADAAIDAAGTYDAPFGGLPMKANWRIRVAGESGMDVWGTFYNPTYDEAYSRDRDPTRPR